MMPLLLAQAACRSATRLQQVGLDLALILDSDLATRPGHTCIGVYWKPARSGRSTPSSDPGQCGWLLYPGYPG
eukprot:1308449-Rhodomonas_salina.1